MALKHRVRVVTGFIPIPGNPRPVKEYMKLGAALVGNLDCVDIHGIGSDFVPEDTVASALTKIYGKGTSASHSEGDNPAKNTKDYHFVQHEKVNWIRRSALSTTDEELLVWIDYGILHVPGVTMEVIHNFLRNIQTFGCIAIPGCWPKDTYINSYTPCWRFCGGVMVVPTALAKQFTDEFYMQFHETIKASKNVEWEVNTLARWELETKMPVLWYQADHDQTMFTAAPGVST